MPPHLRDILLAVLLAVLLMSLAVPAVMAARERRARIPGDVLAARRRAARRSGDPDEQEAWENAWDDDPDAGWAASLRDDDTVTLTAVPDTVPWRGIDAEIARIRDRIAGIAAGHYTLAGLTGTLTTATTSIGGEAA